MKSAILIYRYIYKYLCILLSTLFIFKIRSSSIIYSWSYINEYVIDINQNPCFQVVVDTKAILHGQWSHSQIRWLIKLSFFDNNFIIFQGVLTAIVYVRITLYKPCLRLYRCVVFVFLRKYAMTIFKAGRL